MQSTKCSNCVSFTVAFNVIVANAIAFVGTDVDGVTNGVINDVANTVA